METDLEKSYSGIGGWLMVINVGLVLAVVAFAYQVQRLYLNDLISGRLFSAVFTSRETATFDTWVYVAVLAANVCFAVFELWLVFLMNKRSRLLPRWLATFCILNSCFTLVDMVYLASIPNPLKQGPAFVGGSAKIVVLVMILAYIRRSKRVRETFLVSKSEAKDSGSLSLLK